MSSGDPKGDNRKAERRAVHGGGREARQQDAETIERLTKDSGPPPGDGYDNALAWFCWQEDGWLRVVPDPDYLRVHLKWKFNKGPHSAHYVYCVGWISELNFLLGFLRKKVEKVRALQANPVKDTAYNP